MLNIYEFRIDGKNIEYQIIEKSIALKTPLDSFKNEESRGVTNFIMNIS